MSHTKNAMFVEAKVLQERCQGSYEERLQLLDHSINESSDLFGGDVVLLATYPAHIEVLNEFGEFFTVPYDFNHGDIKLGEPKSFEMDVVVESDVLAKGIDEFFEGGSLAEGLRGCLELALSPLNPSALSPMEKAELKLESLFSGKHLWVQTIASHIDPIASLMKESEFDSLKIDVHPVFESMLDELTENWRDIVREELVNEERCFLGALVKVDDLYQRYLNSNPGEMRTEELSIRVAMFEAFAGDYIEHMQSIVDYIAESIKESKKGCVACAAMIHDEIAKKSKELEFGARFVHEVLSQIEK